jgi:hypothetical protein
MANNVPVGLGTLVEVIGCPRFQYVHYFAFQFVKMPNAHQDLQSFFAEKATCMCKCLKMTTKIIWQKVVE